MPVQHPATAAGSKGGLGVTARTIRRDVYFLCALAVTGAAIALLAGQYALLRSARVQLDNYTVALLQQAADVAQVSIDVMAQVSKSHEPLCSDANLNEMRYMVFLHKELYDIGRVVDGQLACTADWGRFSTPLKLPAAQRQQANGDLLWRRVLFAPDPRLVVDMASHGNAIVFTSPTIFEHYEKFDPAFGAVVVTGDGQHIYRTMGNTNGLLGRFRKGAPWSEIGSRLTSSQCESTVDVCVVTALTQVNILSRTPLTAAEVAAMGGLAAVCFGLLTIRRRRILSTPAEQLRQAIADDRLAVFYQPLVSIRDGRMIGVEALLRVRDEKGNVVSAEVVAKVAEEAGMIGAVTRVVVQKALAEMHGRLTGEETFLLHVNVSADDVIDPGFRRYLETETDRWNIPRQRVVLELAERSTTKEEKLVPGVAMLRSLGYGLYVDDLGTGYSSLAYLSKLAINGIKVDKTFTQSIGKEAVSSTIVEKIVSIAETLGVAVVIEGIETREQADYVLKLCPEAIGQGFLWSKALSAAQLAPAEARFSQLPAV